MKKVFLIFPFAVIPLHVLLFPSTPRVYITERSDFSKYINGKYLGLTYRESEIYMDKEEKIQDGFTIMEYTGEAFVLEETRKNMIGTAKKLHDILPISFTAGKITDRENNGHNNDLLFTCDNGYPSLRNFPVIPAGEFSEKDIGKKWNSESVIVTCPKPENNCTRIPVYAEYSYAGKTMYNGKQVHCVKAVFGVRYKGGDVLGDPSLLSSEGSRSADIYLDQDNTPLFIRQRIDEIYFYADKSAIRLKGFFLHFYDYSQGKLKTDYSAPRISIAEDLPETESGSNFDVTNTKRGLVINLKNINFKADKAELLKGEDKKLDEIAGLLKELKFGKLFVEGHTASAGNPEGEKELSLERAKIIVGELVKRGIPAGVFIYGGAGSEKPIASNENEQGKAKNRRVEITVME